MKAKFRWRKTRAGYALLGFTDVLRKGELPVEYVNGRGPKYWYVAPAVVEKVAYGDYIVYYHDVSRGHKLAVGKVLSPDEWENVMQTLVDAGDHLADVRKMVEAGEELTMQV